jgi:lipoprotein-releasing system ATP-binding protein
VSASDLATIIAMRNMELAARMDRRVTLSEGKVVEIE